MITNKLYLLGYMQDAFFFICILNAITQLFHRFICKWYTKAWLQNIFQNNICIMQNADVLISFLFPFNFSELFWLKSISCVSNKIVIYKIKVSALLIFESDFNVFHSDSMSYFRLYIFRSEAKAEKNLCQILYYRCI